MSSAVRQIAENIYSLEAYAPELAKSAQPGQFAHIDCGGSAYLRRPLSVCDVSEESGFVRFVFELKGEGTRQLANSQYQISEPQVGRALGKGFPEVDGRVLLIGGGLGAAPLLFAARRCGADAVLGFANGKRAILIPEFSAACGTVNVFTDDGSLGKAGVVDLSGVDLSQYSAVFACGPKAMLRNCQLMLAKEQLPLYVSMEEHMACGYGACLVCVCATKKGYSRVCKDGPVFESGAIIW
ncbi:MAG: dihydroorotate dehydrogenase electron transfer subunit [Oscillospiraceae bacterium]|nr:dihydroorotate dehydrogenase electron transfer subunit [Oscillospiraceae bacterium]